MPNAAGSPLTGDFWKANAVAVLLRPHLGTATEFTLITIKRHLRIGANRRPTTTARGRNCALRWPGENAPDEFRNSVRLFGLQHPPHSCESRPGVGLD